MGLDGGIYSSSKIEFLRRRFPKFNKLSEKEQLRLTGILSKIYWDGGGINERQGKSSLLIKMVNMGPLSHKLWEGYCTLYSKDLEAKFGPGRFNEIIKELDCLEVDSAFKPGFRRTGFTKGYRLTGSWASALKELHDMQNYKPDGAPVILDKDGRPIKRIPVNNNAIRSRDSGRNIAKTKAYIPYCIPVNQQCLRDIYHFAQKIDNEIRAGEILIKTKKQRARLSKTLDQIWDIYYLSYTDSTPPGEIPQTYTEDASGRLYGRGSSLQRYVKEVKIAALAGMPLKEIDMSNCHFAIMCELAKGAGMDCPEIGKYLRYKEEYRDTLAWDIFGEEIQSGLIGYQEARSIIKECIISVVNGARHRFDYRYWEYEGRGKKYNEPSIITALAYEGNFNGDEKAITLSGHPLFKTVAKEANEAANIIIESAPVVRSRRGKGIKNLMGKCIDLNKAGWQQKISHLIRGAEAKILNAILEEFRGQVFIAMHDGATVDEEIDPGKVKKVILERTGFQVDIEEEIIYRNESIESVKARIVERCLQGSRKKANQPGYF